jgi:hypothetical protein
MSVPDLGLLLFCVEGDLGRQALRAGIDGLIVDWECRGKETRQEGADTEINRAGPAEVEAMASLDPARLCCRINGPPWGLDGEVEQALEAGATDLFLPMVRAPEEVERFLTQVDGRARVGILVETEEACRVAVELARFPLDWVYVGLNDLGIARESRSIFEAVADGTVERLRQVFQGPAFGFGGATLVGHGAPVPGDLLAGEMARLGSDFTFLRRSFLRDVAGKEMGPEVARMREAWRELRRRSPGEVEADREALLACIAELVDG